MIDSVFHRLAFGVVLALLFSLASAFAPAADISGVISDEKGSFLSDAGDVLTFSISNKPGWATFNVSSGTLSVVPDEEVAGQVALPWILPRLLNGGGTEE